MRRTSFVTWAVVVGAFVLGLVFGPSLAGIASAQDPSPAPSGSPSASASPSVGETLQDLFLDNLAAALNIDRAALEEAITSAGISTADEAVSNGTLTQEQGDAFRARIQSGEWNFFGGGCRGRGGHGGRGDHGGRGIPGGSLPPQASPSASATPDA